METIKTVSDAKKAGTAIGAAAELAVGATLTGHVLAYLKGFPKGSATKLCEAFWTGFDTAAPTVRGLKRVKVTRSESMRIARGIDAGLAPVTGWAESVKAAPKAASGKGAGGGRKPRQPIAPAGGKGAPAPTAEPKGAVKLSPFAAIRQECGVLLALCKNNASTLPTDFLLAVEDLAEQAKALGK